MYIRTVSRLRKPSPQSVWLMSSSSTMILRLAGHNSLKMSWRPCSPSKCSHHTRQVFLDRPTYLSTQPKMPQYSCTHRGLDTSYTVRTTIPIISCHIAATSAHGRSHDVTLHTPLLRLTQLKSFHFSRATFPFHPLYTCGKHLLGSLLSL